MSRMENVITTTFRAYGSNVAAFMGDMGGRMTRFGQIVNDNTRMSERLNNQWRAFGTTIRYAIAGGVTFGLARMVGQIRDINQQLGQMQALSGIGGTAFSNRQINQLGNDLQKTALATITPLKEVNDAAVNFLSTVQNVQPSQLPAMLTQIGQGAKLAQTPIEDLTQAATTFQIAFGRAVNPNTVGQFTRMWAQLIGVAPGGIAAAPTIAQSIPGLASMFQLAPGKGVASNVGQAQLFGLTLGALRTGMPPATAMRGLTYLLQSIAQPTGGARKALAGIGITSQSVEQQGIYANLMKLLHTITASPSTARRLGAIPDDTLDQIDSTGGNLPGIPASEMARLRAMIPRIHGIRAAIILASQLQQRGNVQSVTGDVSMMLQAQNENSNVTQHLRQAWTNLSSRSRLQEATVAVNTMGVQIAQAFNPVFDFVSSGIALHLAPWMQNHRGLVKNIARGGVGFLAAAGIGRAAGIGNLPGLNRIPFLRTLLGAPGKAFLMANAAEAAVKGGTGIGASPQNPVYVVVVGQLFGGAAAGGGAENGSGGGSGPIPGGLKGLKRIAPWAAAASMRGITAGTVATGVAGAGTALVIANMSGEKYSFDQRFAHAASLVNPKMYPNLARLISATGSMDISAFPENQRNLLYKLERGQITAAQAAGIMRGKADVNIQISQVDASGKVVQQKRVHVPVDLWSGGRVPRTKGQAGKGSRGR